MERTSLRVETRDRILSAKAAGLAVGFVPTMGALHEGHLSLVRAAQKETGFVVVSIYVNPTQFSKGEDLDKYPRNLETDQALLLREGVNLLFAPPDSEMVIGSSLATVHVAGLTDGLCGPFRPGHFDGVCTIVTKLLNIIAPHVAYFGQKDYQQAAVVKTMCRDLCVATEVRVIPTVREPDGLAMSSRNMYLSPEERKASVSLWEGLSAARDFALAGSRDAEAVRQIALDRLRRERLIQSIDYVAAVHPVTLEPLSIVTLPMVLAVAVRLGRTRLIDNILIDKG